ncbi:MAG TPA: carboxypeptidase regulatory-like domain-containing protein [Bryobacteraceae bacterium]|jgi:plastocyanin|nr:carboxypeptidase regulatory-like domain-containing protein [Bryobacteraceae bacterium]
MLLTAASLMAGTVRGHLEIVSSQNPDVRKHSDYSGIVVWLEPVSGTQSLAPARKKVEMEQKGKRFIPHILAIEVGTAVEFPNYDPIFHNAFSNYDGQIFDVGLYPPGTSRVVPFRREGIVRIFCNIHPAMSAVIVVLKSPFFTVSGKTGEFSIANVPSGSYRLHVFHERATQQTLDALARTVEVGSDVEVPKIAVSESGYLLLPHKNKYGKDYPPAEGGTYSGVKP